VAVKKLGLKRSTTRRITKQNSLVAIAPGADAHGGSLGGRAHAGAAMPGPFEITPLSTPQVWGRELGDGPPSLDSSVSR
jgi:hypothetical protein